MPVLSLKNSKYNLKFICKVLAEFLEEENDRLRNIKPEVVKEVIHNNVKPDPVYVERERIVEVPIERIVEVPVEKVTSPN